MCVLLAAGSVLGWQEAEIRSIQFSGLRSVEFLEAIDFLKKLETPVAIEEQYQPEAIESAEAELRKLLAERGKPEATVETEVNQRDPGHVDLVFRVVEEP